MPEHINTDDLRKVTDRFHVDHIVELQLIKEAINNVWASYSKNNWWHKLVKFFGEKRNLQILSANKNGRKRTAVTKLIMNDRKKVAGQVERDMTEEQEEMVQDVANHWEMIRDDLHGAFETFKAELSRLLDV